MKKESKKDKVIENMNSIPIIDINVNINIPRSFIAFDEKKHKYKCSACGKGFTNQNGNFQRTNDVLFQCNNGYLPWCKECTDLYVNQITALYSYNEEFAMKDFCQRAGWNYDTNALIASMETYSGHRNRSRISHYAAKKNLNCGGRKTFIDSLKFEYEQKQNNIITSREQAKSEESTITASAVDRWGVGFAEADYKNLDEHYRMLKKNNPNCDNNQEIFIKSLCNLNMLMVKALKDGDSDKYVKLTDQYAKTFKQAGLRTVNEQDSSADECLGVTLAAISQYTPEEYYKDKALYKDFDNIGPWKRKRCMIDYKTGNVVAYEGDPNFSESGKLAKPVTVNSGTYSTDNEYAVMVEQPKFYYRVVPIKTTNVDNDTVLLDKARYYVSSTPHIGFKVHPAFIVNGDEVDKIYLSSYTSSLMDVNGQQSSVLASRNTN